VIDAPQERILAAAEQIPAVKQLVVNRWVQLAAWDPAGEAMAVFENGRFVPFVPEMAQIPVVPESADWYRGHRGHLPPARVTRDTVAGSLRPRRKTDGRPTTSGSQGA